MDEIVVLIYLTRESDAKLCKLSHPQKFTWCITILSFFLGLHSELQKLHMKFVLGNILQESEFWATRKNLLEDEANKGSKQRPGFKSAMLADVRPSADGRTNKVTFSLTTEIIHQIFAEKPAVHRAFLDFVPKKARSYPFVLYLHSLFRMYFRNFGMMVLSLYYFCIDVNGFFFCVLFP
jgi:hypothetical protein